MTQPEATPSVPEDEAAKSGAVDGDGVKPGEVESEEMEPEPIPWTPERVLEWNNYYDIYVMLAALLLVLVGSAVRVDENNPMIWSHLKAGELIGQQTAPLFSDPFSYAAAGERWVDIPWLFQWGHSAVYQFVKGMVPVDRNDPTANLESADQIAVGVLVGLNALARLLTAWILLRIRRPGPGLWWTAICVAVALGAIIGPFGILPGGIAGPGIVTPGTWGMLLLAIEMLLLHRAYNEGAPRALYALVPIFLLWANVDDSFLMGLLILAVAALGRILDGRAAEDLIQPADLSPEEEPGAAEKAGRRPVATTTGLVVLAVCIAACLANPWTYQVFPAALSPVLKLFDTESEVFKLGDTSFFGKQIQRQYPQAWYWLTINYLIIVALGLASFLLNSRRFSWSRFLPFALTAAVWGVFRGYGQGRPDLRLGMAPQRPGVPTSSSARGVGSARAGRRGPPGASGCSPAYFFCVRCVDLPAGKLPEQPQLASASATTPTTSRSRPPVPLAARTSRNILNSTAAEN
ncbi:MAG: hypothetical protein U0790_25540 [Isosphaeraceae bacterium]